MPSSRFWSTRNIWRAELWASRRPKTSMRTTDKQEDYALEELLISRMAKELKGEMVGGAATYCSMAAVKLAQSLYNPDLIDMSGGLHYFDSRAPLAFLSTESMGKGTAKARVSW